MESTRSTRHRLQFTSPWSSTRSSWWRYSMRLTHARSTDSATSLLDSSLTLFITSSGSPPSLAKYLVFKAYTYWKRLKLWFHFFADCYHSVWWIRIFHLASKFGAMDLVHLLWPRHTCLATDYHHHSKQLHSKITIVCYKKITSFCYYNFQIGIGIFQVRSRTTSWTHFSHQFVWQRSRSSSPSSPPPSWIVLQFTFRSDLVDSRSHTTSDSGRTSKFPISVLFYFFPNIEFWFFLSLYCLLWKEKFFFTCWLKVNHWSCIDFYSVEINAFLTVFF